MVDAELEALAEELLEEMDAGAKAYLAAREREDVMIGYASALVFAEAFLTLVWHSEHSETLR